MSLFTFLPMKMEQSFPKRRRIKFRRRGITQKKTYNILNTAKVLNHEIYHKFTPTVTNRRELQVMF
jgi:hypothetical protein